MQLHTKGFTQKVSVQLVGGGEAVKCEQLMLFIRPRYSAACTECAACTVYICCLTLGIFSLEHSHLFGWHGVVVLSGVLTLFMINS